MSCNVILRAVASYEAHPIRSFVTRGIPVALCTDNPVQISTTIGREYAIGHALGLSPAALLDCTRAAIRVSFAPLELKAALLAEIDEDTPSAKGASATY